MRAQIALIKSFHSPQLLERVRSAAANGSFSDQVHYRRHSGHDHASAPRTLLPLTRAFLAPAFPQLLNRTPAVILDNMRKKASEKMQETGKHISVRRGHTDEARTLAKLHVDVWRATYRDYAPKAAFELLDEEKRRPYWDGALAITEPGRGVWVSMGAESILGVVSIGMSDHPAFKGRAEIEHLYVSLRAQGHGIGKRLLYTAIDESNKAGVRGVGLAVVRQNERAREFYRKMGGVEIGSFIDPGPLWRSDNILMAWDFA